MKNYLSLQFLLQGVCLFTSLQGITGENSDCKTPKLGPNDKLSLLVFDSLNTMNDEMWDNLCNAVKQFPKGLITYDYKAGALASGTVDNIRCGKGSCEEDQYFACEWLFTQNGSDCLGKGVVDYPKVLMCYCNNDANKILLANSALRANLKIPETALPTLAINQTYDPCFKLGSSEEILKYFCQVYQNKVGKCG